MRWAALFLSLALVMPAVAQPVRVGVSHSPPYRVAEDGRFSGLYLDIFDEIANRLGWQVQYREAPYRRVLRLAEDGQLDVVLGARRTDEREVYLDFVAPAFPADRRLFFYQTDTHRIERYDDLYGRVIGAREATRYFPRFDEDTGLMKELVGRYENLMLMLERGRVDVVIAPELVGKYTLNQLGLTASVSPYTVPGDPVYLAVPKGSPLQAQAEAIRATVQAMENDGIYQEILGQYLEQGEP
jgi:polar amino acid transport system substrate-binding protein